MKRAILALSIAILGGLANPISATAQDNSIVVAQSSQGFERWKAQFKRRATSSGISIRVFDAAFKGVTVNARVRELDGKQSEFTKTVWEYLDSAVSDARVSNGRTKARQLSSTLGAIERTYGVDRRAIMAIWGVETNFGGFMGGINVIEALATLAYDGRRRNWAEKELIKALCLCAGFHPQWKARYLVQRSNRRSGLCGELFAGARLGNRPPLGLGGPTSTQFRLRIGNDQPQARQPLEC